MVKNAELWELARKIESFVSFTEDILGDPTFVDLFTQIIELRVDAEKVQGEIGGYRQNVDNHITETWTFVLQLHRNWRDCRRKMRTFVQNSSFCVGLWLR